MTEEAHAKLGASSSDKWINCAAALAMEEAVGKPDTGSFAASEGTAAHELGYMALDQDKAPGDFLGETITVNEGTPQEADFEVTHEMVEAVEMYTNYVRNLQARTAFYEQRVDFSHIVPHGFGTADTALETTEKILNKSIDTLYVIDLKYGKGIKVFAHENNQGLCYSSGTLNSLEMLLELDHTRIVVVIVQPRMNHIDEYELTPEKLADWEENTAKPAATKAWKLLQVTTKLRDKGVTDESKLLAHLTPEDFNPTDKGCQWCRAGRAKKCKYQVKKGYEAAIEGFGDLTQEKQNDIVGISITNDCFIDPHILSSIELGSVRRAAATFKTWFATVDKELIERIEDGVLHTGFMLKPTEGARAWKGDTEASIKAMRSAGLQKKDYEVLNIISPTMAEKQIKEVKPKDHAKRYEKLERAAIHRPAGKPA
ncbi:MAG: DUF2800 domain-containing protein, partial [Deltaproteobacteria bacterium]|nr:DUF2800 domain-containing protein [Deltaproteobacteria bacterium]